MIQFLAGSWALLLGIMLLMVGNGMQNTLLGVRGSLEGFSTFQMAIVMSGYFVGFLGGSKLAPAMIRRVGHVRVFAALGSLVSAILILYPAFAHPVTWTIGRVLLGFCLSGVYVTAESWLNDAATNENRGKALSLYLIVQMLGIISGQGLMLAGDPAGFILFIIPSVLVSVSFAPILLSVSPAPPCEIAKAMKMRDLFRRSPLGCIGIFLLGAIFSAQFGMAAVYGTEAELSVGRISAFVAAFYIGAVLLQYPIGWVSDRMDRRRLIAFVAATGAIGGMLGFVAGTDYRILLLSAFLIGGTSNPLYALLIAHANDFLDPEDMAAAAGTMVFANGLGAIAGPLITGWIMGVLGARGCFVYLLVFLAAIAAYAAYRMTCRPAANVEDTVSYAPVSASTTPVAMEAVQEAFLDASIEENGNTSRQA